MRYEEPDSRNRWDSPCHIIQKDDEKAPCEVIFASVLGKPTPKANEATINVSFFAVSYIAVCHGMLMDGASETNVGDQLYL